MKILPSTILMLCLSTLAVAQTKPAFGFIVKAGTFAIPRQNLQLKSHSEIDFKMGHNLTFGLWYSWPLSVRLRLSTELLYRSILTGSEDRIDFTNSTTGNYRSKIRQRVSENSVLLPIKFLYTFKKGGKTSVSLGGGLSHIFASKINTHFEDYLNGVPNSTIQYDYTYTGQRNYRMQYHLNAGFHWILDHKTSLGLEYNIETFPKFIFDDAAANPFAVFNFLGDCFCHHLSPYLRPRMNSFSVSLRHNILD